MKGTAHFPRHHGPDEVRNSCHGAPGTSPAEPVFTSQVSQVADLEDTRRHYKMSDADFALLNPNTRTCPVFRTNADAELTKLIYRRVPVLVNESTGEDPGESSS